MLDLLLRLVSCCFAFACAYTGARVITLRLHLLKQASRPLEVEDVLRDRTLCFIVFAAMGAVVSFATSAWLFPVCLAIAAFLSKRAPAMLDERARRERRSACDEHVDVMADIVAMGVRSGLSFDAALDLYCMKFDNELAQGLGEARMQWTSGLASRREALDRLATCIGSKAIKRFSDTSIQAIRHGSPLADMLGRFSSDIRRRRHVAIERQIERAPVKMLIPTGTCILPAMLILVMGPVLLQFMQSSY